MYVIIVARGKDIRLPRKFATIDDEAYEYARRNVIKYGASSFRFEVQRNDEASP